MQTRIDKEAKTARYSFDSLADVARYLEATPRTWKQDQSETSTPDMSWDLRAGYARAWQLAREGWPEGAQAAQKALKAFAPNTPAPVDRVDFYGFRPHVPRYCAGAPDNMIRRDPTQADRGHGRVLTLYVPVNALARVDASHMRNFGLAVAQYINQMETDGTRVEAYGVICSSCSGWRVTHTWRIKRADQPLDLAVLSFAVGHPAMFRRLGFALRERSDAPNTFGYGNSESARLTDLIDPPPGSAILNGMVRADEIAKTPQDALAYVTKQIEKVLKQADAAA